MIIIKNIMLIPELIFKFNDGFPHMKQGGTSNTQEVYIINPQIMTPLPNEYHL